MQVSIAIEPLKSRRQGNDQPEDGSVWFVLPLADDPDRLPADRFPGVEVVGITDFDPIETVLSPSISWSRKKAAGSLG